MAARSWRRVIIAGSSASRPRSRCGSAATCPRAAIAERVAAAVESCMAAIELLEDLRHDYKCATAAAMVAGNVWNAGSWSLVSPWPDWRRLDLARAPARD